MLTRRTVFALVETPWIPTRLAAAAAAAAAAFGIPNGLNAPGTAAKRKHKNTLRGKKKIKNGEPHPEQRLMEEQFVVTETISLLIQLHF